MKKLLLGSLLIVAACTTDPRVSVIQGCNAYGSSLSILAAARAQGRLTDGQIDAVNQTLPVALSTCGADTPPPDAQASIDLINATLERIIFESGAQ